MPKFKVPKEIQVIAQRARDLNLSRPISQRAAYKDSGEGRVPGTGMLTARRLISGSVDAAQINLMVAWFARHGESKSETEARKKSNSKAAIAWALWGGTPGRTWAKQMQRKIQDAAR